MKLVATAAEIAAGAVVEVTCDKTPKDAFKTIARVFQPPLGAAGIGGLLLEQYLVGDRVYQVEATPPFGASRGVAVALLCLQMGRDRSGRTTARMWVEDYTSARVFGLFVDDAGVAMAGGMVNRAVNKLQPRSVSVLPPATAAGDAAESSRVADDQGEDATQAPANWYPDPTGAAPLRYWDGTSWTGHTAQ